MNARMFSVSVAAAVTLLFVPDSGDACSPIPPPCRVDVVPNYKVPANIPGFWWRTTRYGMEVDPSSITLSRRENGSQLTTVPVTIDLANQWIRPGADLSPGEYTLTIGGPCSVGDSGPSELFSTSITVVPPAPLPESLGPLVVSQPIRAPITVAGGSGSCSTSLDAVYVTADVSPNILSGPWGRMLNYQVRVDGEHWFYSETLAPKFAGWLKPPTSLLYHACEDYMLKGASLGLDAGEHEIVLDRKSVV